MDMHFFRSRSFLLALISTITFLIVVLSYATYTHKEYLIDDMLQIGVVYAIFNLILFYIIHNNKTINDNLILSENRLQYAMRVSGEGIFDWDMLTNKIYFSESYTDMLGYSPDEFGTTIASVRKRVHADDLERFVSTKEMFINGELSEYSVQYRMIGKDGRIVWIHSKAEMMRDRKGSPVRMIGTHRDITSQKYVEEDLADTAEAAQRNSQAKSNFLAHMSHEIRTPLTAITGIAEILKKNVDKFDDKQKQLIDTLSASSMGLKELINDILDFSKIERGDIDLDYKYFSVSKLMQDINAIMSITAAERNIDFQINTDAIKNLKYNGDDARIRQILINLIGNALKFTETGYVRVMIDTHEIGDLTTLQFSIQDTGIGIDADKLDVVFDEFQQEDKSVSRKYGGTGLGLPISKKLAILMGGDISVESKKGVGSTFTLILPIVSHMRPVEEGEAEFDVSTKINDQLSSIIREEETILIVDDYAANIIVLTYLLDDMDINYDTAENGQVAIEKWKEKHYDLILMDVQMPVMDGLTATKNIREYEASHKLSETPIIGMTAHAMVEDENVCMAAGMNAYLPKPIDQDDFRDKILFYLDKSTDEKKAVTG